MRSANSVRHPRLSGRPLRDGLQLRRRGRKSITRTDDGRRRPWLAGRRGGVARWCGMISGTSSRVGRFRWSETIREKAMKRTIGLATVIALTGAVAFAQSGTGTAGRKSVAGAPAAHMPSFHAERTCKVVKEDGNEAFKDCLSDEKAARQKLEPLWSSYSASLRAECTSETIGLKVNSYADLTYCLQLRADTTSSSKGASKTPN